MTALNTDKFRKVAPNTGWNLDASGISDASIDNFTLVSANGLPTDTAVLVTINRVNASGLKTPDKMERIIGVIDGDSIINCIRGVGGTAQPHAGSSVVEILISDDSWNDLIEALSVEHNQDGTHKSTIHTLTPTTTFEDTDELSLWDSITETILKITGANFKAALKTFFDALYPQVSGWIASTGTWSATDANTISIAGVDLTGVLQKGDKIKVTNNSAVKYFYISTAPVFSTNTTFDVAGEVDLVAGAITLPNYSKSENPQGFKDGKMFYTFFTRLSANQAAPGGFVQGKINLNTEEYDPNGNFDNTTNYRWNCPVTGYYDIKSNIVGSCANSVERVNGFIRKNNVEYIQMPQWIEPDGNSQISNYSISVSFSGKLLLQKGDYLELYAAVAGDSSPVFGGHATQIASFLSASFVHP